MRYLFGPVPSRRYGKSLGVDLAKSKTCSFDCRFCQLGRTKSTTVERSLEPPMQEVLAELRAWIADGGTADFVTASGSGEPTLHLRFGDLFRFVHGETPFSSLLLTNGSLFGDESVRKEAALADVVKVSLHSWNQTQFEQIVRPHKSLRLDEIVEGYRAFREIFPGRLDVEVFLLPGVNDTEKDAEKIASLAGSFLPQTITLNTAVRPPADSDVGVCTPELLGRLLPFYGPNARIASAETPSVATQATPDEIAGLVARHPVSLHTLAHTFGRTEEEMRAIVSPLGAEGRLRLFDFSGKTFVGVQE